MDKVFKIALASLKIKTKRKKKVGNQRQMGFSKEKSKIGSDCL